MALPWTSISPEEFRKLAGNSVSSTNKPTNSTTPNTTTAGNSTSNISKPLNSVSTASQNTTTSTSSGGLQPNSIAPSLNQSQLDYFQKQYGGIEPYVKRQQERLNEAFKNNDQDLIGRLYSDAGRVGYSLTTPVDFNPKPTLPDYSWITDMVNNELTQQKMAIEQELARLQQANELAINRNNTWLQEQIKDLEKNRIQAGAEITNFQNRRGGFYSGGLDYQLGTNNQAFTEAKGDVTQEIAARNADIWNRNALLAQQAAEKLSMLEQQVPGRIQQLIQEQMERDRQAAMQEAGLTGFYQGQPTLSLQDMQFNQGLASQELALRQRSQDLNEAQVIAQLTGFLPDGTPTNQYQQQILDNAWRVIGSLGFVPSELESVVGVKAGTRTLDAIQVAIQQQNANTAAFNAQTSRMNADLKRSAGQDAKVYESIVINEILQADNAQQALDWINNNAKDITGNLGVDAFNDLRKMIPSLFGEANTTDPAKLRQQAVSMAQKDTRWLDSKQDKEALIQEYIKLLGG